jgi:type IV secretion system protein VirB4
VVFATQSLADIAASDLAPVLIESCHTRVFLPNARAREPQIQAVYRRFGLSDRQIDILVEATPKRDYYAQTRGGDRLFELGLGPVALAFCAASSSDDQTAITVLLDQTGRDGFGAAWLRHRGLPWAADLLTDLQTTATDPLTPRS